MEKKAGQGEAPRRKKEPTFKHVTPLIFGTGYIRSGKGREPLSACDCDNHTCNCDHSTDICVGGEICAAENVDVDACGAWG